MNLTLPYKNKDKEKEYHRLKYMKNKSVIIERNKKWRLAHPEWSKEYYAKNKDQELNRSKKWYKKNHQYALERKHKYDKENYEIIRKRERERRQQIRLLVLKHYGGNDPKCVCCGETHIKFLSIDHINGFGTMHRNRVKDSGSEFYRWIINNNYPNGFQILCYNCNMAKGFYGVCPHGKKV